MRKTLTALSIAALAAIGAVVGVGSVSAMPHSGDHNVTLGRDSDSNRWTQELSRGTGTDVGAILRGDPGSGNYPHPNDDGDADRMERGLIGAQQSSANSVELR